MQTTDAELVKGCLAGDHGAWESIVRQYHQRLYNLAYRFTGRFDEAEDLTQEIFLKVYRTLNSYRAESGALVTWMVRVGRNHMIDHYRKFKTERTHTESLEVEYDKAEENPARYSSPATPDPRCATAIMWRGTASRSCGRRAACRSRGWSRSVATRRTSRAAAGAG